MSGVSCSRTSRCFWADRSATTNSVLPDVDWAARTDHRFQTNLSLDEVAALSADQPGSVRAFVGYSGWSAGQLEGELEQKAWVLVKPDGTAEAPLGARTRLVQDHERARSRL